MAIQQGHFKGLIVPLLVFGGILWLTATVFAANYVIIANKGVSEDSLSKTELRAMFLGEKIKWENKKYIKLAIPVEGDAYREFLQEVVLKTPSQYDNHWMKQVYSGKASVPQSFSDPSKLVEFVVSHPGAIGIVEAGQSDRSVKTISIK
jgi:ABC-type phosphate transport system substrate-binding protein